jgi:hypothetical protein
MSDHALAAFGIGITSLEEPLVGIGKSSVDGHLAAGFIAP